MREKGNGEKEEEEKGQKSCKGTGTQTGTTGKREMVGTGTKGIG